MPVLLLRAAHPKQAVLTAFGVATTAAVAGDSEQTVSTTLLAGPLPGSLAGVRGIATDGKVLYATSGQAVIKITLP